jgi:hypothetical protein
MRDRSRCDAPWYSHRSVKSRLSLTGVALRSPLAATSPVSVVWLARARSLGER